MKFQIFCFSYAGGTGKIFKSLEKYLDLNIELVKIEYSGHGTRSKERLLSEWDEFLIDMSNRVNKSVNMNAIPVFFGYSMGSIVAYELIVRKMLVFSPVYFVGASHEAPNFEWASKEYYKLDDDTFISIMVDMGGIDKRLLHNQRFLKLFIQPLKCDYHLIGTYTARDMEKIDCPISFFYSPKDISLDAVDSWRNFTKKKSEIIAIGDNHFFINDHPEIVAGKINEICRGIESGWAEKVK